MSQPTSFKKLIAYTTLVLVVSAWRGRMGSEWRRGWGGGGEGGVLGLDKAGSWKVHVWTQVVVCQRGWGERLQVSRARRGMQELGPRWTTTRGEGSRAGSVVWGRERFNSAAGSSHM
jgi:hypothetical protein